MSETRTISLGGPEWSRGAVAAGAVVAEPEVEARRRDAATVARRVEEVRALLFCGWSRAEIRLQLHVGTELVDLALSRMSPSDRARRDAAVQARSRSKAEPVRVFAVPTPTGGRIYGRLDANADVVEAVRRRTGLDPWDYEERAA
ncbi:hypothetical protein [Albimonas pacifica]|uniref:Uncharacterized protein n=1 Tax=Albimonas pacifica TaxID=1114924 RepID=A0A1I3HK05_9RHOB|nr:hypothetical protein [Albimonas pacifica]SFI35840.1 hypothetical protein SAMN05216258_10629 [Albimonas pacifica]